MNGKEKAELAIKILSLFVALFGVAAYFLDKHLERDLEKRAASLALVREFYEDESSAHRLSLFEFWRSNQYHFERLSRLSLTDNELREEYNELFSSNETSSVLKSLFALAEFYDRVGLCVNSGVCASTHLGEALCLQSKAYYSSYGRYLEQIGPRSGYWSLGKDGLSFSQDCHSQGQSP